MANDFAQDIINLIGLESAAKIFKAYGGTRAYIPKNISNTNHSRDERIRQERLSGESPRRLSKKYNMHVRKIFAICKSKNIN